MKKFSLIIPTRDRAILFHRCIEAIWTHTTHKNEIELVVICDNDDPASIAYVENAKSKWPQLDMRLITRDRTEFSNRDYYNFGGDQATGELIWIFADDLELTKFNWDEIIWSGYQGFKVGRPDNCFCFSIKDNTPPPSHTLPKFPCFPMFTRECRALFGWYLHPSPPNWGVDYIAYKIFQPLDRITQFHEDNYINHISYHNHQVKEDETSLRIGRIFNRLKMRPEHSTDRILGEEVPMLRAKLAKQIEDCLKGDCNNKKPTDLQNGENPVKGTTV